MTDTYQAIFDGVRSRISGGDISYAAERAMREALDLSRFQSIATQEIVAVSHEMQRPSVLFKPVLTAEGDSWCALYGPDLQIGIAGFGDTPDAAMRAFDVSWFRQRTLAAIRDLKDRQP